MSSPSPEVTKETEGLFDRAVRYAEATTPTAKKIKYILSAVTVIFALTGNITPAFALIALSNISHVENILPATAATAATAETAARTCFAVSKPVLRLAKEKLKPSTIEQDITDLFDIIEQEDNTIIVTLKEPANAVFVHDGEEEEFLDLAGFAGSTNFTTKKNFDIEITPEGTVRLILISQNASAVADDHDDEEFILVDEPGSTLPYKQRF